MGGACLRKTAKGPTRGWEIAPQTRTNKTWRFAVGGMGFKVRQWAGTGGAMCPHVGLPTA